MRLQYLSSNALRDNFLYVDELQAASLYLVLLLEKEMDRLSYLQFREIFFPKPLLMRGLIVITNLLTLDWIKCWFPS